MKTIVIREAESVDLEALWEFLALAAYEPNGRVARQIPVVAAYLEGWKRPGDFGVIAEIDGLACGAAWARRYTLSENPVFFAGERTPEVSIGVRSTARGLGIGTRLLKELEQIARNSGLDGLCLNVRDTNPARLLYARAGYQLIEGSEVPNRVGGKSLGMLLHF